MSLLVLSGIGTLTTHLQLVRALRVVHRLLQTTVRNTQLMESLVEGYFSMAVLRCSVQQQARSTTCQLETVPTRSRCGSSLQYWAQPDLLVGVVMEVQTKSMPCACSTAEVGFVITGGVMTLTHLSRFPRVRGITLLPRLMARRARFISTVRCLCLTHRVATTT